MRGPVILLMIGILGTSSIVEAQPISPSITNRRVRLLANVNYNIKSRTFEESTTFDAFLEQGSTLRSYDASSNGIGFEIGGIYSFGADASGIGVLGSFEVLTGEHDATFDLSAPHPLYFDEPRTASTELTGLEYAERALNVDFVYTIVSGSIAVDVFGGPTFFFVETELANEASFSSEYPFDEINLATPDTVNLTDDPIGFNVGGAVTYRFTQNVGVSFQARFADATATVQREGAEPIDLEVGGFRIGGGIRIAF